MKLNVCGQGALQISKAEPRTIRVLMLSHGCQSTTEGQPRAVLMGKMPEINLRVLTPNRWNDYGRWRSPQQPIEPTFEFRPMKVRFPWTGPGQWYLHYYPDLAKQIREFQPDVIDIWEEPWSLVAAHACRVRDSVLPSARVIVETEQNIFKQLPPPFRNFHKYVLKNTDSMIGRSRESIEVLRRHGYSGRAYLVPNAVDTDLFCPKDKTRCRHFLATATNVDWSDRFIVGFAGRIVLQKGIIELVESLTRCPDDVVLLIVGDGSAELIVRERVRLLNLNDRVIFLPARPLEQLPEIFGALDVLAVPSRTTARWKEQFGRVIIEAHACGIPVIGSSSGAIPDVVGAGGRIVAEQDSAQLANSILKLYSDPALRYELGKAGLAQVDKRFSWAAVVQKLRQIYCEMLETEKSGST